MAINAYKWQNTFMEHETVGGETEASGEVERKVRMMKMDDRADVLNKGHHLRRSCFENRTN